MTELELFLVIGIATAFTVMALALVWG